MYVTSDVCVWRVTDAGRPFPGGATLLGGASDEAEQAVATARARAVGVHAHR